jgi:hypothetical protein
MNASLAITGPYRAILMGQTWNTFTKALAYLLGMTLIIVTIVGISNTADDIAAAGAPKCASGQFLVD